MHKLIYLATLLIICGYALWRGERPERFAALIMITGSLASIPAAALIKATWVSPELGILGVDLIVLGLFVALSLWSDRFWPMWITGFQLTSVAIHLATMAELTIVPKAYAMAQAFWAYPMLCALLIGTWNVHRKAKKRMVRDS